MLSTVNRMIFLISANNQLVQPQFSLGQPSWDQTSHSHIVAHMERHLFCSNWCLGHPETHENSDAVSRFSPLTVTGLASSLRAATGHGNLMAPTGKIGAIPRQIRELILGMALETPPWVPTLTKFCLTNGKGEHIAISQCFPCLHSARPKEKKKKEYLVYENCEMWIKYCNLERMAGMVRCL